MTNKRDVKGNKKENPENEQDFPALAEKAHGIKNILQAVSGGMDVVEKGLALEDIEKARRGWSILRENLDKIRGLVLDMLKYSREDDLHYSRFHFNELVGDIVTAVAAEAQEKNTEIKLTEDDSVDIVEMDADRIRDVIMNLLMNAIESVKEGLGGIEVISRRQPDGKILLEVADNGTGISDTEMIFKPFYSSRKKGGTGLGLAITRRIVEKHGGQIEVESEPGKGAKFRVFLPQAPPEAD